MHPDAGEPRRRNGSSPAYPAGPENLYPLRVLLIDDGAQRSQAFRRLSERAEDGMYIIDRATTAADGFGAIAADEHDVYVVDHHVGTRTGFDLLSWVTAGGMQVPIVFVAGPGDHGTGVTAVTAGASCYVVEDTIGSGLLEHCVRHAVEQRRALSRLSTAGIMVDGGTSTTKLLARVSQRLREPASALLDLASRALDSELPVPALESIGAIGEKAHTLITLANDLNDLAMLEAGHLQFHTDPFSLRGLVAHVRQSIPSSANGRGRGIAVDISADVPDTVVGDPGRLRFVIVRFIETVRSRNSTSSVLMRVGVEDRSPGSITLRFEIEAAAAGEVAGNGTRPTGADPSEPEAIPEILLDRGVLGMPIALETVSRMGGHVTVDGDREDHAAVQFTVRLQMSDTDADVRPVLDDRMPLDGPVLVIADTVETRRSTAETLDVAGISHEIAPSVAAWMAAHDGSGARDAAPALIVIDSSKDSFAECDDFKRLVPAPIPIVIVVASGSRGDAARCRERGVRGYLARPLDPGDLVDVIRSTLALSSSGDVTTLVTRHWLREGRSSLHVLVVDDSTTNRFLLTRMLDQRGHSTMTACDGAEAVAASRENSFDVVLMDVMMPVMDGLEATRRIRTMYDEPADQPFIVGVSAFVDRASIDRASNAGMDAFLAKPVRPDDLFVVVEQRRTPELTV